MGVLVAAARPASVALSSRRSTAPSSRRFANVSFSRDASASARGRRSVPTRAFGSSSSRATAKDYHTHIVKPGENLSYIARDFATSISALREANGMRHATGDVIYEGQEIRVPVTPDNHGVIELIRAKSIVAKNAESTKTASTSSKRPAPPAAASKPASNAKANAKPVPSDPSTWTAPYRSLKRGAVNTLNRSQIETMLPRKGPAPPGLEHARSQRDADIFLLVEMPDCEWCAKTRPAWTQLAKAREKSDPDARVCVFVAATPDDRAWADKHLAAHSFPTIIAMPKRGGVYKYGGVERTPALLGAFADEACRAIPPATSVPPRLSPSQSVANAVATSLVGAVGVEAAGAVGGAAELATPFVLAGAGIALFVTTALKFVELAFGPGRRRDARGEPLRGSAQTAAARLDAAGFGEPAPVGPPPLTTASGEPIAPAAAARSKSAAAAAKEERKRLRRDERARRKDDAAIPFGASVEKLAEWIQMVESELGDLVRRFFFLLGAWFRLQNRLWRARFAPPPRGSGSGSGSEPPPRGSYQQY